MWSWLGGAVGKKNPGSVADPGDWMLVPGARAARRHVVRTNSSHGWAMMGVPASQQKLVGMRYAIDVLPFPFVSNRAILVIPSAFWWMRPPGRAVLLGIVSSGQGRTALAVKPMPIYLSSDRTCVNRSGGTCRPDRKVSLQIAVHPSAESGFRAD